MARPLTILVAASDRRFVAELARSLGDHVELVPIVDGPPDTCPDDAICFVDWLLPTMSGAEMCRRLRSAPATANALIVMVLGDDSEEARRRALRAGADDYLVGPLTPGLLAKRLSKPSSNPAQESMTDRRRASGLTINLAAHRARWCDRPINLRPNEFRLLALFVSHPDRLLSRSQLIEMLGKDCGEIDLRTVDVWIGRLRRALREQGAPDAVRTVRSLGYVFDSLAPAELILA